MSRLCPKGHLVEGRNAFPYTKNGVRQSSCRQCRVERTQQYRAKNGDFLPPETNSVMASYKEPLKPVEDGFGYYGTIAYDETKQYTQCHVCGNFYKTLGPHVSRAHKIPAREYRLKFGLPTSLSLNAPSRPNKNYEHWQNLTQEEKDKVLEKMRSVQRSKTGGYRNKALYYKNMEGRCPDQLLDKIEILAKKLGRTPSRREFVREYKGYLSSVELTFGTWGEALQILKLTPKPSIATIYDREVLIKLLLDFKTRYGRDPMSTDCNRGLLPSRGTFKRYFGSFSEAKEYVK